MRYAKITVSINTHTHSSIADLLADSGLAGSYTYTDEVTITTKSIPFDGDTCFAEACVALAENGHSFQVSAVSSAE